MKTPDTPPDELRRLEALRQYDLLDTPMDPTLDDLAALTARLCDAPIALISLIDEQRQWFKSRVGFSPTEISRDISFCGHAILGRDLMLVPDATRDERFAGNPLVKGAPGIRFYAGAPLVTPDGQAIGALCVMDREARQLSTAHREALRILSRQVMTQLELIRHARALRQSEERFRTLVEWTPEALAVHRGGKVVYVNPSAISLLGAASSEELVGRHIFDFIHPDDHQLVLARLKNFSDPGVVAPRVMERFVRIDRTVIDVEVQSTSILYDGAPAVHTSLRDVTAHRQSALDSTRLAAIVTSSDDAIIGKDLNGVITSWNRGAARIFGYAADEMVGTSITRLIPPNRQAEEEHILGEIRQGRSVEHFETVRQTRDGRLIDVSVTASPIRDASGAVTGVSKVARDITARKDTERGRLASEARYRALFDYSPHGILIADGESRYIDGNASICQMLGCSHDELVGRSASSIVAPEELAHIAPALTAIHEAADYHREWRLRRKDGTLFTAEITATKMPDGNLLGMVRDVTERKQAEARIRALNRLYAVLSAINHAIVRTEAPGALLSAACRIAVEKGRFRLAWIGLVDRASGRLSMAAHAGATSATLAFIRDRLGGPEAERTLTMQCWRTGRHVVCNDVASDPRAEAWRTDALERQYRAVASLPLIIGGTVAGVFNLCSDEPGIFDAEELGLLDELATDIAFALEIHERDAERHRIERALGESEERFRQVVESINEVFWMTDPAKHRMLYVSPAYERIWGRSCASLYQAPHTWMDAVHPEDRERVVTAASTKQATGGYDEVYRIVRPDGTVRWIHDLAFPVRDPSGQPLRVVGTAEDITDRRQLEDQLRQSQKMDAVGQLAGGVAHDFNNILTVITGYGSLLTIEEPTPEETAEAAQQIVLAAERAASLTRQLLAFSRRQVMQPRRLNLNEVITGLAKMLARIVGEDVRLDLQLHPSPVMVVADAGMIDQVLMNLVVNARDAMPEGGRIVVETTERDLSEAEARRIQGASAGRHACLSVQDSGSGIAPEHLTRIFEPFFTTKEAGKGTGLGLATVFGIVSQHGGGLTLESQVGVGTTFHIYLPTDAGPAETPRHAAAAPGPARGTETILVVEDDPSLRRLTRLVLEREGYQVLDASGGPQALQIWQVHQDAIRLVLTDLVMPDGMSGRELARHLHAVKPTLRIIFSSGYSADIAGRELTLNPGENFVQKPYPTQSLLDIVRRALDG